MNFKRYFFLILMLALAVKVDARILLPQVLSSNMVLQRDKPVTIWGFGAAGEPVSVSFAGQLKQTTTDASGKWKVLLDPLKTNAVPAVMTIKGSNEILLSNILVGEVWLCSGQSNMEYPMRKLVKVKKPLNPKLGAPLDEVEKAHNPLIRIFLVNRKELAKPDSIHKSWSIAEDSALRAFSAAGYFFAKELQAQLGVPIGMISSAVSGSAIEPWIPKEKLASGYFQDKKTGNDPGKFYTPMIEPLTPLAIRGFLWYQGETNCFLKENISYTYKMDALINSWRTAWKDQELSFYYVQIAPFNYSATKNKVVLDENTEPEFWEAQAQIMRLPNTGMIVTTDLNDYNDDLHPNYKWVIGRRLANWALAKTYQKPMVYSGPMYKSVKFKKGTAEITFDYVGGGMVAEDGKALSGFELAGPDGKFIPAKAVSKGQKILVSSKGLKKAVSLRFGWSESAKSNLYNTAGLPAMPFRTNNPLINQYKPYILN